MWIAAWIKGIPGVEVEIRQELGEPPEIPWSLVIGVTRGGQPFVRCGAEWGSHVSPARCLDELWHLLVYSVGGRALYIDGHLTPTTEERLPEGTPNEHFIADFALFRKLTQPEIVVLSQARGRAMNLPKNLIGYWKVADWTEPTAMPWYVRLLGDDPV